MKPLVIAFAGILLLAGCTGPVVTDAALQNCYENVLASVTIPTDISAEQYAKTLVHIRAICADEAKKNPKEFQSAYGD